MKQIILAAALAALGSQFAFAADKAAEKPADKPAASCEAQATEKKLAGADKDAFLKKCGEEHKGKEVKDAPKAK